jgi:hypothetical protein
MNVNEMVERLRAWSHDERLGDGMLLRNAADMLAELLERISFLESVVGQSSMDLFRDNCLLRAQVERLTVLLSDLRTAYVTGYASNELFMLIDAALEPRK